MNSQAIDGSSFEVGRTVFAGTNGRSGRVLAGAQALESGRWDWLATRGMLEAKRGNPGAATHCLDEALRRNPHDGDSLFCLGAVLYEQGDVAGAREQWQRALECSLPGELKRRVQRFLTLANEKLADGP